MAPRRVSTRSVSNGSPMAKTKDIKAEPEESPIVQKPSRTKQDSAKMSGALQDRGERIHGLDVPSGPEEMIQSDVKVEMPNVTLDMDSEEDSKIKVDESATEAMPKVQSAAKVAKDAKDAERAVVQLERVKARIAADRVKREKAVESGKKTKSETYGLCEGTTPFPRWPHPTAKECQEVYDILHKRHPECQPQPATIPPPSEFVAGCGEVRSILDALVRTRLSASTTGRNSNAAYQGMVKRYGLRKSGVGKGSVDYNKVRLAPVQDLFYAIKVGGLAVNKGADIKAMLDLVYEENQARRRELEKESGSKNRRQRDAEIKLAEEENLSLDHCYTLPTYDAIYKFMSYPGIGVKTAACVAMFCMQRPSFAVDTHVFRLAKWLGWVPPPEDKIKGEKNVDRDTTFSHLEVRVPDHLKYMLHQLFLKHGKTCPRCRGITGEGSADWSKGCVIEHLVQRTGAKKGGIDASPKKRKRSPDESTNDMSDVHSDTSDAESASNMSDVYSDASEDEPPAPVKKSAASKRHPVANSTRATRARRRTK